MNRDERFYAFIVSKTNRSRSYVRRFSVHKRWVRFSALAAAVLFCAAAYGVYGLTQQAAHMRIEAENNRLREENERQRRQLQHLENRVDAIEDKSRKLSEMSGVEQNGAQQQQEQQQPEQQQEEGTSEHGAGGPGLALDADAVASIEARAARLEEHLRTYEAALKERERAVPSIWPVEGESTDSFGVRGNPFGGGSSEFHPGQDIAAPRGTPVIAPADGVVIKADWQNGYGQTVVIDHGNGLTTRYGHLSKIEVSAGQEIRRGEELGQVGSTGRSTGPHLHYEVRIGDVAVSPLYYLPAR
jgi:murein DD-endopeptidase MepM/ murein hydrolase activator NlpD